MERCSRNKIIIIIIIAVGGITSSSRHIFLVVVIAEVVVVEVKTSQLSHHFLRKCGSTSLLPVPPLTFRVNLPKEQEEKWIGSV